MTFFKIGREVISLIAYLGSVYAYYTRDVSLALLAITIVLTIQLRIANDSIDSVRRNVRKLRRKLVKSPRSLSQ
jgi:hypothetical protein